MKSKIFMYLFFFAVLLILFMFMNQKSIYERQEKSIVSLTEEVNQQKDSITSLTEKIDDLNYFTLQGNENAMSYLEALGLNPERVENTVSEAILEQNLVKGGNPLIPFEGYGEFRVNNMKFLNHRWIQAEFSDGKAWGEMIIEYFYNEKMELQLSNVGSVLYPN